MSTTRRTFGSGIFYTAISKYSNVFISILITAILARLLTPQEFGLIAIVMVFISFFQLLSDFGIGPAIIQNKALTKSDVQSIFTFSILISIILAYLFYLVAPLISSFYKEPQLENITKLLSLAVLFFSFNVVPRAINLKKFRFKQVGIIAVIVQIITGALAILFAFMGYSYYALVLKAILDGFFIFLGNYLLSPLRLERVRKSSISKILKFASYQFLFNFINYFSRNADNLIIGKYFSTASLGFYDKSYKLMMMPVQNLTHVITPVLQPILSDFQDNKDMIFRSYLKIVKILAIIGFPLSIFLYYSASEIVQILFGSQWEESIPIFKILALTVGIQIILSSSGSIFQAANRTDLLFLSGLMSAVLMIGGVAYGVFVGENLRSVGYGLMAAFVINFFQSFYFLIKLTLNHSLTFFFKSLRLPILTSFFLFVLMYLTSTIVVDNGILSLLFKISQLLIVIFLMIFFDEDYKVLISNYLQKLW